MILTIEEIKNLGNQTCVKEVDFYDYLEIAKMAYDTCVAKVPKPYVNSPLFA